MGLHRHLLLSFWAAALVAGCSTEPAGAPAPDADPAGMTRIGDAVSPPDGRPVSNERDAATAAEVAPPGNAEDAGPDAAAISPRMCMAGHACTGSVRCQRACLGALVYRCSCVEGRFVCTGCISVDAGIPDSQRGPALCPMGAAHGRRCDRSGSVCRQGGDAGDKLCVCGDLGPDRLWICQ